MAERRSTRAAAGSGTVRERKDGLWEARVTVGRDPGTGRQIQKSFYGPTQKAVLAKLRKIQAEQDNGTYTEPEKLTVSQWMDTWLAEYAINVKDATMRSYKDNTHLHIKPGLGAVPLQKLSPHMVQKFYNDLSTKGRILQKGQKKNAPAGLSAKSVRIIHSILHRALKQAALVGYIKANPTEACILPKIEKKEMSILSDKEIPTFLSAVEGHRHGALYLTTLFTGMRRGEALGLTWDAVDVKAGVIRIYRQMQKDRVEGGPPRFTSLKNDKTRMVSPPATVFRVLKEHRRKQNENRLRAGALWEDMNLVFCNELGQPLDGDSVYRSYKRLLNNNGLSDIRLHDLRHTAATIMIQNGDDIKTVQNALGHATAGFTLDIYTHVTERMQKESAKRMERYIKRIKNA